MANPVIQWASDNPLMAGGAALAVVVVVMLVTGGGSEQEGDASGGMGSGGVQAYYAAVAMQSQAGSAVQIASIEANAQTNRALIGATYGLEAAKVSADTARYQTGTQAAVDIHVANNLRDVELNAANQEANVRNNAINLANAALGQKIGNAQRGAIVQAAITGQQTAVNYKPDRVTPVINSVGNAASKIGRLIGGI